MKKHIISLCCGTLVYIISVHSSFSQDIAAADVLNFRTTNAASSTVSLSAKLNKTFSKLFKGATGMNWYVCHDKYVIRFMLDGLQHQAVFNKYGELIYQFNYCTEKDLPADVRKLVRSNYYDQHITWVNKVEQDNEVTWVITVEDDSEIIKVRVADMLLEETQRITKIE